MKEKTVYVADDGKEFNAAEACIEHERFSVITAGIEKFLATLPSPRPGNGIQELVREEKRNLLIEYENFKYQASKPQPKPKQEAMYCADHYHHILVGRPAVVFIHSHPDANLIGNLANTTNKVIKKNEDGSFETKNTLYRPRHCGSMSKI